MCQVIKVPFHKQVGNMECWFACFLMVCDTIEGKKSNYEAAKAYLMGNSRIIKDFKDFTGQSPFQSGAGADVITGLLNERFQEQHPYAMENIDDIKKFENIRQGLKNSLEKGYPAILGEDWGTDGGHFYVIAGMDKDYFYVVNPMRNGEIEKKKIAGAKFTILYHR